MINRPMNWLAPLIISVGLSCGYSSTQEHQLPAPLAQAHAAVETVPDGIWTFYNDERGVFHQGNYYLGYVTSEGQVGVTRLDSESGECHHMVFDSEFSNQIDDHNNPAILVRSDNTLLLRYALHHSPGFFVRTSLTAEPSSAKDWSNEQFVPRPERVTYSNLVKTTSNNVFWALHREINYNPTLVISHDEGATWSDGIHLIRTGQGRKRPYFHFASNQQNRWDLLYSDGHPRNEKNSIYHIYFEDSVVHSSSGQAIIPFLSLPLDHDHGQRGTVVYEYFENGTKSSDHGVKNGRAAIWDLAYDSIGNPVCVFQVQKHPIDQIGPNANRTSGQWPNGRIKYYWARWNGLQWETHFIAEGGRGQYEDEEDFGGGICLDPEDPRRVYISSNAKNPFDLSRDHVPLSKSERYEIYRGFTDNSGASFNWETLTHKSELDNFRPFVPHQRLNKHDVFWVRGEYESYTEFNCSILGMTGESCESVASAN